MSPLKKDKIILQSPSGNIFSRAFDKLIQHPGLKRRYCRRLLKSGEYDRLMELILEENRRIKKENKKTVMVFGNCQAIPLENVLNLNSSFTDSFSILNNHLAIHEMPGQLQKLLLDNISEFDLIITQNILNKEWLLNTGSLKGKAKEVLVYPTCFFKGYHPDAVYLKLGGDTLRSTPLVDYHSGIVVHSFIKRCSINECTDLLVSGEWVDENYAGYIDGIFQELYLREKEYDVGIVDFLHENYKKEVLFHTFNHPVPMVMFYIADEINRILGVPLPENKRDIHFLDSIKWLISETVKDKLGLIKYSRKKFIIEGKSYTPKKYVSLHYRYYKAHPEVVRENEAMVSNMIKNPAGI